MEAGIHSGHRKRMKEQAINVGLENFSDHQILEILLFYAIPQRDTNELAHLLLNTFGSLSGVFEASYESLLQVKGIKENAATLIRLLPQIWRAYELDLAKQNKEVLTIHDLGEYFVRLFIGKTTESVYAAALDYRMQIKNIKLISSGEFSNSSIPIKSLVDFALRNNTDLVVIAHNHPHGRTRPSSNDLVATQQIAKALKAVDMRLVDHFIVADNEYISMQECGTTCLQI